MVNLGTNLPGGAARGGNDPSGRRLTWFEAIAASPRPAVVDHSAGGDRIELSGRVLANWAAKTANLLDVEGHGPGSTILVDLPLGWKSLALLLGAARAGVQVRFATASSSAPAESGPVDLVVSGTPGAWSEHPADLWAVSPGTLQTSAADAELPSHALDYAAEVQMQADQCHLPLPGTSLPSLAESWENLPAPPPAEQGPEVTTEHAARHPTDDAGAALPRWSHRERGLVVAAAGGRLDRATARAVVETWDRGHPVVLVPEQDTDLSGASARLVDAERLGSQSR
ncbi:TIGR03089 family protein [Citricoccus sp.]|uniref:TIGR03089 family protein n=1 Tax=Citricoccus sp. TaxID=1978372 RepID=UPI0028BEE9AC|nr:TIGR03089 family protein [Citricoccus sp.]